MEDKYTVLKHFVLIIGLLFIFLMWVGLFYSTEARKAQIMDFWGDMETELLKMESQVVGSYEKEADLNSMSDEALEKYLIDESISKIKLLESGRVILFKDSTVLYAQPAAGKGCIGKTIDEIYQMKKNKGAIHFEEYASLIKNKQSGKAWFICDRQMGKEIAAVSPIKIREKTYVLVFLTHETEVLEKYGYFTGSLVSLVIVILTTLGFFVSYYFFNMFLKDLEEKDCIINEKALNLEQRKEELKKKNKDLKELAENLKEANNGLEKFNRIAVTRELAMIELKKELKKLKNSKK